MPTYPWTAALEQALELAVADALDNGPATPSAVRTAERNMRVLLEQWLRTGRMPGVKGYQLSVEGGAGLMVDLKFIEEDRRVEAIKVNVQEA